MQCWHHFVYENKTDPVFAPLSLKTTGNRETLNMDIVSDEAAWAYPWFNHCIYASLLPPFSLILWYFVSTKAGEAENSLLCLALPVRSCGRRGRMAVHHLLEQCKVMCCRVDELTKGLFPPPQKINFHRFCNLPVRWGEIMAPALSLKFPRDLSVFSENWIQNDRIIQTTNCLPESIKALKALPLEIWNLHPPGLPALWVSYNHCCMS